MNMKIGVGITTRNRNSILLKNLTYFDKYCPKDFKLIIVDDASTIPFPKATFRFEKQAGIAKAKNKCFELLSDCDHVFLFDDDCYPIHEEWWKPYLDNKEPHLMYIFSQYTNGQRLMDISTLYYDETIIAYSHPRGCMLYYDMRAIKIVGTMNEKFEIWGYEHVNLSDRIFNNGLTTFRYMDVRNSQKLIHSMDESITVVSSVTPEQKIKHLEKNTILYKQLFNEK